MSDHEVTSILLNANIGTCVKTSNIFISIEWGLFKSGRKWRMKDIQVLIKLLQWLRQPQVSKRKQLTFSKKAKMRGNRQPQNHSNVLNRFVSVEKLNNISKFEQKFWINILGISEFS